MKLIAATALAVLLASPLAAEPECAAPADVASILSDVYGESRIGAGLDANGSLAEFWVNPEAGSWTVVYTKPGAPVSCVVAQGVGYVPFAPTPAGEPA